MIKVSSQVSIQEIDSKSVPIGAQPTVTIKSHWNDQTLVVLEIDGKNYSMNTMDIQAAIQNATNSARFK
jgi:hypothetical protein